MPGLELADSPMYSFPHFHIHPHTSSSSPLSSPSSHDSACHAGSILPSSNDDPLPPPDLACTLRFGDMPAASSFGARARSSSGLMQNHAPNLQELLESSSSLDSICNAKAEVKLLNRSQSKLSKRSVSPVKRIGKDLEEGAAYTEAPACCAGAAGLCGSANCVMGSPRLPEAFLALQKFLPYNNLADDEDDAEQIWSSEAADSWPALDVYSSDDFRMFEFKVRKCVRGRSHDWTECPFAHPGEKARRRDPRRYRYSGTACPDFRKGNCRRGEACEYSHGVFECWLHPTRYRTQPCKDGKGCRRRVCFFAHTPEQLRLVAAPEGESPPTTPGSCGSSSGGSARSSLLKAAALSGGAYDGSPLRRALAGSLDGPVVLELFLDDGSNKGMPAGAACMHHHHHHHWIGMGSSPSSTLVGLSACATSPSPISSPVLSPASPLVSNSGAPAHRRHLDRLRSIPTLCIPAADDVAIGSPPSPHTMAELMSTLQISPSAMAIQSCRTLPSAPSVAWPLLSKLQRAPSAPNSPKPRYGHPMSMMQISAPELPSCSPYVVKPIAVAAMAGSTRSTAMVMVPAAGGEIQRSGVVESDDPDLGWVNELVQ